MPAEGSNFHYPAGTLYLTIYINKYIHSYICVCVFLYINQWNCRESRGGQMNEEDWKVRKCWKKITYFPKKQNSSFSIILKFFMESMDIQSLLRSTRGISFLICTRTSDFWDINLRNLGTVEMYSNHWRPRQASWKNRGGL